MDLAGACSSVHHSLPSSCATSSFAAMTAILLDQNIRDYVLIPIFVVVVLMSMMRSNLLAIFKADSKIDMKEVKTNNLLSRCKMLRANSQFLCEKSYNTR